MEMAKQIYEQIQEHFKTPTDNPVEKLKEVLGVTDVDTLSNIDLTVTVVEETNKANPFKEYEELRELLQDSKEILLKHFEAIPIQGFNCKSIHDMLQKYKEEKRTQITNYENPPLQTDFYSRALYSKDTVTEVRMNVEDMVKDSFFKKIYEVDKLTKEPIVKIPMITSKQDYTVIDLKDKTITELFKEHYEGDLGKVRDCLQVYLNNSKKFREEGFNLPSTVIYIDVPMNNEGFRFNGQDYVGEPDYKDSVVEIYLTQIESPFSTKDYIPVLIGG